MTVALFAGIRVRDVTAARAWYERLLGEPALAIAPCEPAAASSLTLEEAAARLARKAISFGRLE